MLKIKIVYPGPGVPIGRLEKYGNKIISFKYYQMLIKSCALSCFLLLTNLALSQNFKLMRYDEDYSFLRDSSKTFYNKIKYRSLSKSGDIYMSLGGEAREELDYTQHEDWGETGVGRDVFFLQRYHLHGDIHLGNRVRIFGQLRSGLENGRKSGPRKIDEDQLNVQNLFVDIIPFKKNEQSITLRVGRQELQYGGGRLIDAREGPNLRLYFDGIKASFASARLTTDAFIMSDAEVKTGIFDNKTTRKANLWGVYSTYISPKAGNLDLYYLGINRLDAVFDEGVANESRHTLGSRYWKNGGGFGYNLEVAYQFGKFGTIDISAWTGSAEVSYMFENGKGKPTIKLRHDYISGDKKLGDGKLNTFNPLYPKGGYFGMNPQVGPANLIDIHPYLAWDVANTISLTFDAILYWRQQKQDGIYRPDGSFSMSGLGSEQRYIGTAYVTSATWDITPFIKYNIGLQYFKTGPVINEIIPNHKDAFFVGSVLSFKF